MRLRYDKTISADPAPLVLHGPDNTGSDNTGPDNIRVEIHIREEVDRTATLLAFRGRESGREDRSPPEKTIQQGPYQVYDQAVAAKRAIVAQLKDAGFELSERQYPIWSMAVQRSINATRKQKEASAVDCRFDPKDVFLDW